MITKEQIMNIAFSNIANQKFKSQEKFTAKQVGDIISIVALMVADPEPKEREVLYRKLISYINLPEELQHHMFKEILEARQALILALTLKDSENPLEVLEEMLKSTTSED